MTMEKIFLIILDRIGTMEVELNTEVELEKKVESLGERIGRLEKRVDKLEAGVDTLEYNTDMEIMAVRREMEVVYESLKKEISVLNSKVDVLLFTKDVEGYDKINVRIEALEKGYRELKEKVVRQRL